MTGRQYEADGYNQHYTVTGPAVAKVYQNFGYNVSIRKGDVLYIAGPTARTYKAQHPNENIVVLAGLEGMGWIMAHAGSGGLSSELDEATGTYELIDAQIDTFYSNVGSIIGSSIGDALSDGRVLPGIIYSSVIGEIGESHLFRVEI